MYNDTKRNHEIRLFLDTPNSELGIYQSDSSEDVNDIDVDPLYKNPLYKPSEHDSEPHFHLDVDEVLQKRNELRQQGDQ